MLRRAGLIAAVAIMWGVPGLAAPAQPAAVPAQAGLPASPAPKAMPRWEYKVITYNRVALLGDSETELRLLGFQGWELVSAIFYTNARTIVCFLTRPVGDR